MSRTIRSTERKSEQYRESVRRRRTRQRVEALRCAVEIFGRYLFMPATHEGRRTPVGYGKASW